MQALDATFDEVVKEMGARVPYVLVSDIEPYKDFADMKTQFAEHGFIKVSTNFSHNTIFEHPETNYAFRAWHDSCHLYTDSDFSEAGERTAALQMMMEIEMLYPLPPKSKRLRWIRLIDEETNGQDAYYRKHGTFPIDQRQFAVDYLSKKYGPDWMGVDTSN